MHIKYDVIKLNIQCIIKYKFFNKAWKKCNRNMLFSSKSSCYSFIHNVCNSFSLIIINKNQEYNSKGGKSGELFLLKKEALC